MEKVRDTKSEGKANLMFIINRAAYLKNRKLIKITLASNKVSHYDDHHHHLEDLIDYDQKHKDHHHLLHQPSLICAEA